MVTQGESHLVRKNNQHVSQFIQVYFGYCPKSIFWGGFAFRFMDLLLVHLQVLIYLSMLLPSRIIQKILKSSSLF